MKKILGANWKTTLGGILAAIGTPLANTGEGWVQTLGVVLATIGTGLIGVSARDKNVSSEESGAKLPFYSKSGY